MKPDTAAKIARRIGMVRAEIGGDLGCRWEDGNLTAGYSDEQLAAYLLTGDRPLRVIGSWDAAGYDWQVGGRTKAGKVNARVMMLDGDNLWRVLADVWEDTPALAIVRCAEALEEGNE